MLYTTVSRVVAYGSVESVADDVLLNQLIEAYSRQIDRYCAVNFGQATYVSQERTGHVDRDGVLFCYAPVPTMTTPTAFEWRYGRIKYTAVSPSFLDVEERRNGCVVRVLGSDYVAYRGQRIKVRMSYTGGWADLDAVPGDFEMLARRLIWWAYKLREAPIGMTAIPSLGQLVIPPSGWPGDVRDGLRDYVRYTE